MEAAVIEEQEKHSKWKHPAYWYHILSTSETENKTFNKAVTFGEGGQSQKNLSKHNWVCNSY